MRSMDLARIWRGFGPDCTRILPGLPQGCPRIFAGGWVNLQFRRISFGGWLPAVVFEDFRAVRVGSADFAGVFDAGDGQLEELGGVGAETDVGVGRSGGGLG